MLGRTFTYLKSRKLGMPKLISHCGQRGFLSHYLLHLPRILVTLVYSLFSLPSLSKMIILKLKIQLQWCQWCFTFLEMCWNVLRVLCDILESSFLWLWFVQQIFRTFMKPIVGSHSRLAGSCISLPFPWCPVAPWILRVLKSTRVSLISLPLWFTEMFGHKNGAVGFRVSASGKSMGGGFC